MHDGPLVRLARFCYRRRRRVLLLWIVGAAVVMVAGFGFAPPADDSFAGGDTESAQAQNLIKEHFPPAERRLAHPGRPRGRRSRRRAAARGEGHRGADARPARRLRDLPVQGAGADLARRPDRVRPDPARPGRGRDAQARRDQDDLRRARRVRRRPHDGAGRHRGHRSRDARRRPDRGHRPAGGGDRAAGRVRLRCSRWACRSSPRSSASAPGWPASSCSATSLPAPSFSPIVAGLIGLGVGVDYALFIVTRYREALDGGADPEEATGTAIATAGRSVAVRRAAPWSSRCSGCSSCSSGC